MNKKIISVLIMLCAGPYLFAADPQSDEVLAKRLKVHSLMFKNMLEDFSAEDPVKVLQDMQNSNDMKDYIQSGILGIMRMAKNDSKKAVFKAYNSYLNGIEDQEERAVKAVELLKAANFFDIEPIIEISAEKVAEHYGSQESCAQFCKDPEAFANQEDLWLPPDLNEMVIAELLLQYKDQLTTPELKHTLNGHTDTVFTVAYHPSGNQLASGSRDNTIKLWNTKTGVCEQTFVGHTSGVSTVAYHPSRDQLAFESKYIKLWNTKTGAIEHTLADDSSVLAIAYHPSGNQLASGYWDNTIKLWNTKTGVCEQTFVGHISGVSADHISGVFTVAYHPLGNQLASGSFDKKIRLWNLNTRECDYTLTGHTGAVFTVAYHPSGDQLASGSYDNTIKLWNLNTRECDYTLTGHTKGIDAIAYHPSEDQLALGSYKNTIRLWNIKTRECEYILTGHTDKVRGIAYHPSGNQLASGSFDKTVRLWSIPDYKQTVQLLNLMQALYVLQQLQKKEPETQQDEKVVPAKQDQSSYFKELHDSLPDAIKQLLNKK